MNKHEAHSMCSNNANKITGSIFNEIMYKDACVLKTQDLAVGCKYATLYIQNIDCNNQCLLDATCAVVHMTESLWNNIENVTKCSSCASPEYPNCAIPLSSLEKISYIVCKFANTSTRYEKLAASIGIKSIFLITDLMSGDYMRPLSFNELQQLPNVFHFYYL